MFIFYPNAYPNFFLCCAAVPVARINKKLELKTFWLTSLLWQTVTPAAARRS